MTLSWRMVFKINNTLPEEVVVKIVPPQAVKYISLIRRDTGIIRNTNMKLNHNFAKFVWFCSTEETPGVLYSN